MSAKAIEAVDLPELPKAISKKLPRYRRFGVALLGRLAVDQSQQGQGIGELLFMDAFHRCLVMDIPVVVIVVDTAQNFHFICSAGCEKLAQIFRHRVLHRLLELKWISPRQADKLLAWHHHGFNIDQGEAATAHATNANVPIR